MQELFPLLGQFARVAAKEKDDHAGAQDENNEAPRRRGHYDLHQQQGARSRYLTDGDVAILPTHVRIHRVAPGPRPSSIWIAAPVVALEVRSLHCADWVDVWTGGIPALTGTTTNRGVHKAIVERALVRGIVACLGTRNCN